MRVRVGVTGDGRGVRVRVRIRERVGLKASVNIRALPLSQPPQLGRQKLPLFLRSPQPAYRGQFVRVRVNARKG